MRETEGEPVTFFPVDQGQRSDVLSIVTRSQLRAYAQSFSAVEVETPSAAAACSAVRPAKNRSLTSAADGAGPAGGCFGGGTPPAGLFKTFPIRPRAKQEGPQKTLA